MASTDEGGRPRLRDALARALADESLELLFYSRDEDQYVDARGYPAELPRAGSGRASVEIDIAGQRVGAIAYDALLIADPGLVRAAGRVIAPADRARPARRATGATGDAGNEGRPHRLGTDAPSVALDAADVRTGLETASESLRGLVQGVMPALLIERGLYAATEDLVDRMPLPTQLDLPSAGDALPDRVVSTGYFVVAEALTNGVEHSKARELAVRLARSSGALKIEVRDDGVGGARLGGGSGLRGISDRLDVLGGRLVIDSPPGGGTLLRAEVPCES